MSATDNTAKLRTVIASRPIQPVMTINQGGEGLDCKT